ncbi:hypothetical protein E7T09_05235 [Deinococcus sp. KSM4-11]|uniref:hypothetical protein n=1 Tax=Deinococcus sp. KSM4-11 TaxID=2568654 RepID=UPI0010A35DF3|nr:hypothetical protein [Deinococcus sp. KSM4-11]THF88597.1 hypothetical protein E7T09_05235 [Deinococcus sp. KSM4-11]
MTQESVKRGFRFVSAFMILLVGLQLLTLFVGFRKGTADVATLFWCVATAFVCWNIYAGRMWARHVLVLLTVLQLFYHMIDLIAALTYGALGYGMFTFVLVVANLTAVCALYMYEPAQDYFRYIGGDT